MMTEMSLDRRNRRKKSPETFFSLIFLPLVNKIRYSNMGLFLFQGGKKRGCEVVFDTLTKREKKVFIQAQRNDSGKQEILKEKVLYDTLRLDQVFLQFAI